MRFDDMNGSVEPFDGRRSGVPMPGDPSIGALFKRLGADTADLVRQEAALAKAEMREIGTRLIRDAIKVGVAVGLAFVGVMSLGAFLVIGGGLLLGGAYWFSALVVGGLAFMIGSRLLQNATSDIKKRGIKPQQTVATLREDKAWAAQRAKELKHDLTTNPMSPNSRT